MPSTRSLESSDRSSLPWLAALGGLLAAAAALTALSLQGLTEPCAGPRLCQRVLHLAVGQRLAVLGFAGGSLVLAAVAAIRWRQAVGAREPSRGVRRRRTAAAALALGWAVGAVALAVGWWFVPVVGLARPVTLVPTVLAGLAAVCLVGVAVAVGRGSRGPSGTRS